MNGSLKSGFGALLLGSFASIGVVIANAINASIGELAFIRLFALAAGIAVVWGAWSVTKLDWSNVKVLAGAGAGLISLSVFVSTIVYTGLELLNVNFTAGSPLGFAFSSSPYMLVAGSLMLVIGTFRSRLFSPAVMVAFGIFEAVGFIVNLFGNQNLAGFLAFGGLLLLGAYLLWDTSADAVEAPSQPRTNPS